MFSTHRHWDNRISAARSCSPPEWFRTRKGWRDDRSECDPVKGSYRPSANDEWFSFSLLNSANWRHAPLLKGRAVAPSSDPSYYRRWFPIAIELLLLIRRLQLFWICQQTSASVVIKDLVQRTRLIYLKPINLYDTNLLVFTSCLLLESS